jgi:DNA (cytosine-5)-methyltransferase 1
MIITAGYGERKGQAPRVPGLDKPLGTVTAGGGHHALVTAFLAKHYGGVVGHDVDRPVGTVTARDHHSVVTAQLELPSGLASSFVSKFYGTSTGAGVDEPLPTVTGQGQHLAEVRAFLVKYYGSDGDPQSQQQTLFDPLHTVTTKARFGLVTVHGVAYQIADIGMRMLAPHELFGAQGFPPDYVLDPLLDGKPLTKTQQIELAGNSVCPPAAFALVAANARTLRRAA